jgi:hypothetical protein
MNRKHKLIASLLAVPLTIGAGYYLISPKVIVSNLSETEYDELIVSLPSIRISLAQLRLRVAVQSYTLVNIVSDQ